MALHAGQNLHLEDVVLGIAQMATNTGDFQHGVVYAGFAINTERLIDIDNTQLETGIGGG